MVRAISGGSTDAGATGDNHEWVEYTNYDPSCTYDLAGVRAVLTWSTINHYSFTFPAGTTVAPGASVVLADSKAVFLADASSYGLNPAIVFDLGASAGDVIGNSDELTFTVYAAGATLPFETAIIKSRATTGYPTWPVHGQSFAFPSACDPSLRLDASNYTTAHWVDVPATAPDQYGMVSATSAALYGFPGKRNALGATCP